MEKCLDIGCKNLRFVVQSIFKDTSYINERPFLVNIEQYQINVVLR